MTLSIRTLALALAIAFVLLIPQGASAQRLGPDREGGITGDNATRLNYFPSPSAPACRNYCEKNSNCTGFTWIKPGTYNPRDPAMCYLFSYWTQMTPHSCCISGVQESSTSSLGPREDNTMRLL